MLIREINSICRSPLLISCKLTLVLYIYLLSGLLCGIHYYFEQEIMEECESDLTAYIHEGYMFMRKVLGGIELFTTIIHELKQ